MIRNIQNIRLSGAISFKVGDFGGEKWVERYFYDRNLERLGKTILPVCQWAFDEGCKKAAMHDFDLPTKTPNFESNFQA
jgi:hypothetical protein